MQMHHLMIAGMALLAVGCGTGDDDGAATGPEGIENGEADQATDDTAADGTNGELPDNHVARAFLYQEGVDPAPDTSDGEVVVTVGSADEQWVPILVHNGTDQSISRVEVSGRIVDGDGETITTGEQHNMHPNVVMPGEVTFGFVYAGTERLEGDATVQDPSVDFREGLGEFEDITGLDVETVEQTDDQFIVDLSNPHEVDVDGPIDVSVGCMDTDGLLIAVASGFADRDTVEAGGSSTASIDLYGATFDCDGLLVGASGYAEQN